MRKIQTSSSKKRFYHQTLPINNKIIQQKSSISYIPINNEQYQNDCTMLQNKSMEYQNGFNLIKSNNGVTRPPTCHPYSGYSRTDKRSREKYSAYSNAMIFSKDQLKEHNKENKQSYQKHTNNQNIDDNQSKDSHRHKQIKAQAENRRQTVRSLAPCCSNQQYGSTLTSAKNNFRHNIINNSNHIPRASNKESDQTPGHFKLLLNQIKASIRNFGIQANQPFQLINILSGKILFQHQTNLNLQQIIKQKQRQIEDLNEEIEQLNKKLKSFGIIDEAKKKDKNINAVKKTKKGNINMEILLENCKLAELNENYLAMINSFTAQKSGGASSGAQSIQRYQKNPSIHKNSVQIIKGTLNQKNIKNKIQGTSQENGFGQLDAQLLRCKNRISYLQMKLNTQQQRTYQICQQNQDLKLKIKQLQIELRQNIQQNALSSQKLSQWRQRAMMQMEDGQIHLARQQFLLFSIKKLRQSNKNLTDKLLMNNGDGGSKTSVISNANFQYQVDFFKSIRPMYFDNKCKSYRLESGRRESIGMLYDVQSNTFQQEYANYRKHQEIDLQRFSYARPSFYAFIEQIADSQISMCRVKGNTSVSRIFIQILRALMYSKLNQFLYIEGPQKYTRFPEFVYSWFEKFYFSIQKNAICALQPYMQKPMTQQHFYRDLMNVRLDQSWQIITFREFLLEELCLQQLYFYLMCQNILFKKAGITKETQFLGQFSVIVEYNCAKSVIDIVLSDFQSWNITFLTNKLRQKVVTRKNIEYIEVGFFMRCLIEYYKIQRINRFKYISKLCQEFKSCEKGLRFTSFVSVINRFTEVSFDQKMKLYRICHNVGCGKITPDIIFTVCNEELIFLKYLKLKSFFKLPVLTQRPNKPLFSTNQNNTQSNNIICVQPSHPYIYQIFIQMKKILKDQENFIKKIESYGVMDTFTYIFGIQKVFSDKISQNDSSVLKCKHFIHFIYEIMNKIRNVSFQNFYQLIDQQGKKRSYSSTNPAFWVQIDQGQLGQIFRCQIEAVFNIYRKLRDLTNWKQKVYNFRINNAARKIQRQVRKKFIQPYMQLYKIIFNQIKKPDGIQTPNENLKTINNGAPLNNHYQDQVIQK